MFQKYFKKFKVRDWLSMAFMLVCAVMAITAVALYNKNGATIFEPELDTSITVCSVFAIVIAVISLAADIKVVKYTVYLLLLYAFIIYIKTQATYLMNIFLSIDGSTFSSEFLGIFITFALSWISGLTSAILSSQQILVFNLPAKEVKE